MVSDETVKSHVKRVLRKAGARDRAQLTSMALRGSPSSRSLA
ncbi:MAG: LuxR C-terminal-related transcriptional regulator [Nocardioidaceae bacterium]|nr:LuxR C-terminal-related transcriptional regulator [Nocardioidaceae bacterium]